MNTFEKLWEEYLRTEHGTNPPPPDQVAALRGAFFTGAWCQMTVAKKLLTLESGRARFVLGELEQELAREVISARTPTGPMHELAA